MPTYIVKDVFRKPKRTWEIDALDPNQAAEMAVGEEVTNVNHVMAFATGRQMAMTETTMARIERAVVVLEKGKEKANVFMYGKNAFTLVELV